MNRIFKNLIVFTLIFMAVTNSVAQNTDPYFEGSITRQNKNWRIGITFKNESDSTVAIVDFIDIGVYGRRFSVIQNSDSVYLQRPQPNGSKISFAGKMERDFFSGKWNGIGIKDATFGLKKCMPLQIKKEEVSFGNKEATLSGTLMLPAGKGPFPVIIFMHGGSADDRMVYYTFALPFLKKNIAALIYDKRSVGKSTGGDWRLDGLTALADDALAGVALLKERKDINGKKIALFGHSEGGWTSSIAASRSKDVAFLIVSGASFVCAADQTIFHRSNILRRDGFDDQVINKVATLRRQLFDATKRCYQDTLNAAKEISKIVSKVDSLHNKPWAEAAAFAYPYPDRCPTRGVMELLFKDPLKTWQKITIPVLALWGEKDIVVPVEKGAQQIPEALSKAVNRDITVKIFPRVNHFIIIENDNEKEWDFQRQPQEYIDEMAEWLRKKARIG